MIDIHQNILKMGRPRNKLKIANKAVLLKSVYLRPTLIMSNLTNKASSIKVINVNFAL